jgi:6-phosphogluconate dehydrogenase
MSIQQPGQGTAAAEATDGAGHFVKMVHNGIEYADMHFIGEAYELLKAAGLDNTSMRGVGWCAVL